MSDPLDSIAMSLKDCAGSMNKLNQILAEGFVVLCRDIEELLCVLETLKEEQENTNGKK